MKICTKCKIFKLPIDFDADVRHRDGLQSHCKLCIREKNREWTEKNRDKKRTIDKKYRNNNIEKNRAKSLNWSRANPERNRKRKQEWAKKNPYKVIAQNAKRKAQKLMATPQWLTEQQWKEIEIFYKYSEELSVITGIRHHVDHILPLQGKEVCGLHVPWNLQVLTAKDNLVKNNKMLTIVANKPLNWSK